MIDDYLSAASAQLIERARRLTALIPRNLPRAYDVLAARSRGKLNSAIVQLQRLTNKANLESAGTLLLRVRAFRRIVAELDVLETTAIAALNRAEKNDHRLNGLLERIAAEIAYPLISPVTTSLSKGYFYIYPEIGLLFVPLAEAHFLLHLADLYHELAHPLLSERNDPLIEPFQTCFSEALGYCLEHTRNELIKVERSRGPESFRFFLRAWEASWAKFWVTEFFCDIFAACAVGPAYGWSHLHLSLKRGGDPFSVPLVSSSSHPSDDARMRAILLTLERIRFSEDATKIAGAWKIATTGLGYREEPEYRLCYPDTLLLRLVEAAVRGTQELGIKFASPTKIGATARLLNEAWKRFWSDPSGFSEWEKVAAKKLLDQWEESVRPTVSTVVESGS